MSQLKQLELLFTARHKKLVVGGNQSFPFFIPQICGMVSDLPVSIN